MIGDQGLMAKRMRLEVEFEGPEGKTTSIVIQGELDPELVGPMSICQIRLGPPLLDETGQVIGWVDTRWLISLTAVCRSAT